jgi:hypothetical protein
VLLLLLAAMAGADSKLLDFSVPLDVPLLDATVNLFYTSTNNDDVRAPASAAGAQRTGGRPVGRVSALSRARSPCLRRALPA